MWGMLLPSPPRSRRGMFIGSGDAGWLDYALAQFESIALYLRLSFWPHPLILDYGPGGVKTFAAGRSLRGFRPGVAGGHAALLCGAGRRWVSWGYGSSRFWLPVRASFRSMPECAAEKRMYLPLAAVILLTVVGGVPPGQTLARSAGDSGTRPRRFACTWAMPWRVPP